MMKQTMKIAYGGILTALSIALMFLTGLIPFVTYALPAIAGVLLISAVIELGTGWAVGIYIATGLLSAFIAPDKEAAVMYIVLFGYYPILKKYFEKIKLRFIEWIGKIALFNATMIASGLFVFFVMGIQEEELLGQWYIPALLILGNIMFIMYDIALSRLINLYCFRIAPHLKKVFKL